MRGNALLSRLRRPPQAPALVPDSLNLKRFAVLTLIGALGGVLVPSLGPLRQPILVIVFLGLNAKLFDAVLRRKFTLAWGLTAFLCALEPAFRAHALVIPYLALNYILLACGIFTFILTRPRKGAHTLPVIAYGAYIALEILGSTLAEDWPHARGIVVPSILLLMFLVNSRRVRLTPSGTTFVLASYIAGAVTLAGFALRAHLAGNITYGSESNIEASGGMGPNHISMLLAIAVFACVVLSEDAKKIERIVMLGVATMLGLLMVLTFSRGGTVLVLASLLLYYVFLRPTSPRTIVALVAIGLMSLVISYGATEITDGKIARRYGETNTSNRFAIVVHGWSIYTAHPMVGVGTSNFRAAIAETEFGIVSGAHNELIRAAAEHGTFGLITWLVFIISAFVGAARLKIPHRRRRSLRIVLLVFATTSMFYNGLKLTVQPMLVLLALSAFTAVEPAPKPTSRDNRTDVT